MWSAVEPDYLSLFTSIRRACDSVRGAAERELHIELQARAAAEHAIAERQAGLDARKANIARMADAQQRMAKERTALRADIQRIDGDTQAQIASQRISTHLSALRTRTAAAEPMSKDALLSLAELAMSNASTI